MCVCVIFIYTEHEVRMLNWAMDERMKIHEATRKGSDSRKEDVITNVF